MNDDFSDLNLSLEFNSDFDPDYDQNDNHSIFANSDGPISSIPPLQREIGGNVWEEVKFEPEEVKGPP